MPLLSSLRFRAWQGIFLSLVLAAYPASGASGENAAGNQALEVPQGEESAQGTEPSKPAALTHSPPTIPLPPPILPSFYNNPIGLDQVYAGRSLSHIFSVCGDGVYDPGEDCDDGNRDGEDGCSDLCRLEDPLACGDGRVGPGERCDDGNIADGDGCSATCQSEGICGDGIADPGEECDDGNKSSGDGCSRMCFLEQKEDDPADDKQEDETDEETPSGEEPQGEDDGETGGEDPEETQQDPLNPEDDGGGEETGGDPEEDGPVVTYRQGQAVTTIPGCTGTCVMEVTTDAQGNVISMREMIGERKLNPGATYTDPVMGDVYCATGTSASAANSSVNREEAVISLRAASIVSCRA